jgi:hypothetical protein
VADEIKVPIKATYDDKEAKEALADAKKIDAADPKLHVHVDADSAKQSLSGLKSEIGGAQGLFGKASAAAGGLSEMLSGPMVTGLGVAGAALTAAVSKFTGTAKAAKDLGDAVGLSTESASRWIAVADDFQVSAGDLQSALGKTLKSLDAQAWKDYGIATRDAGGGVRDTSEILVDALSKISSLSTEQARAKAGTDLFGKGWAAVAPMVGHTRDEYEKMLGAVSDGQVVTKGEAARAEQMRLAQDALSDALGDVTLAVGKFAASMYPAINQLASATEQASKFVDVLNKIPGGMNTVIGLLDPNPIHQWSTAYNAAREEVDLTSVSAKELFDVLSDGKTSVEDQHKLWQAWADSHPEVAVERVDRSQQDWNDTLDDSGKKTRDMATAADEAKVKMVALTGAVEGGADGAVTALDRAKVSMQGLAGATDGAKISADRLDRAWDNLKGTVSDDQAWLDVQDSFDDMQAKAVEAWNATKSGAADAEQKNRDYQRAVDDSKQKVIDYGREVLGLPPERVTEILAMIDNGSVVTVEQQLRELTAVRTVAIKPILIGGNLGLAGATSTRPGGTTTSVSTTTVFVPLGSPGPAVRRAGARFGNGLVNGARR